MLHQTAHRSFFVALLGVSLCGCASRSSVEEGGIEHYARSGDAGALAELEAYSAGGRTKLPPSYLLGRVGVGAGVTLAEVEREFVLSGETSALDLLGEDLGQRFRSFEWGEADYPGGPVGENEELAGVLADALDVVTPERRANRGAVAVIRRAEATDALWDYILGQWREVPGEEAGGGVMLNRHAVPAYVRMREAAAADGVDLTILSGHRDPKRAAANAARVGNSFAVASFSSHSLGLAIDVELPRAEGGTFPLSTRPMAGVVEMRASPVHKWLHLNAHRFGWYPFQHEPWHWEYNPPGFRDVFFADRPGGTPPRVDVDD